ncbi:MAG: HepT-like ribonuclease domain-containing protein [bacterium]
MPKRNINLFVLDIIISIDRIKRYSNGLRDGEALRKNETLCSAIVREFGIIGEAMNQILQTKKLAALIKPEWRDIVDFRNVVIHEYFGLSFDEVFKIIKKELPAFEKEIITLFKNLWEEESVQQSFEDTLKELHWMGRGESIEHLTRLKKTLLKDKK